MIIQPVKGPSCRFNFGSVDQGLGYGSKIACVPAVLADALIDSLVNDHPVSVTLDDGDGMTSLLEAWNGRWFVVHIRHCDKKPADLTVVEDRPTASVADELIQDLECDPDAWSCYWGFGGKSAQEKITKLRKAIRKRWPRYAAVRHNADWNCF